ncbi:iron-containing alcohol dehydrogenase [Quatrionicoccus australiensis]|uniref:iron-containing alcohol dehydrogenase n=1 Tax=Quatrionicoccus australiensis TaxID=138118 RepID=UPI001CF84D74|nr:iron-containing alcohol dehydrogenase [Quatrionicoccus australiensis]UCV13640.1 iron-containing alcohol dehydrogenase [Quatrionicoccus australiensis]
MNPSFDFSYHNPTQIHFGPNSFARLADLIPRDARVLLLYGGGSIKKNGIHAEVCAALAGRQVIEFAGVEPNPTLETLSLAVDLARREKITFILGVGGGSVADGAKFIACAALYDGDGWDIVSGKFVPQEALPVGIVLTLPATGSESNAGAVVTRRSTLQKKVFFVPPARPRFAILNPDVMASLPDRQLENGVVDAFVHVCEQYLTYPVGALVQDGYAEAVLRALKTLADSFDQRHTTDWRQNLMWAANQALCGVIGAGVPTDWATHRLAVELTALYGIDHGRTLSIIQPWLLRELIEAKRAKLEQMGREVFRLPAPTAEQTIAALEAFYRSLNMPLHLSEAGVADPDAATRVMQAVREHGNAALGGHAGLDDEKTTRIIAAACG